MERSIQFRAFQAREEFQGACTAVLETPAFTVFFWICKMEKCMPVVGRLRANESASGQKLEETHPD